MIRADERQRGERESAAETNRAGTTTRVHHTDEISVEWYAERCVHSGRRVRALPLVSDPGRRPWADLAAADADTVSRAVLGCPSSAPRLTRHHGALFGGQPSSGAAGIADPMEHHDGDS